MPRVELFPPSDAAASNEALAHRYSAFGARAVENEECQRCPKRNRSEKDFWKQH